jgi:hypothetical protein
MGLMGFGGLVSIVGGVMFLVLVYLAMRPGRQRTEPQALQPSPHKFGSE